MARSRQSAKPPALTVPPGPYAVVFSGGGSHGGYGFGRWSYFWDKSPEFRKIRYISGSSTGALLAGGLGAAVTGDPTMWEEIGNVYRKVWDADVIRPSVLPADVPLLEGIAEEALKAAGDSKVPILLALAVLAGKPAIYDTSPLFDIINRYMTSKVWQRIIRAGARTRSIPIEIGFCVVSLNTGVTKVITNRKYPDRKILAKAMLASASAPVIMPPVDIFGDGDAWVDGGVTEYIPIRFAFKSDVIRHLNAVFAISHSPLGISASHEQYKTILPIMTRVLDMLLSGVYVNDVDEANLWNVALKARSMLPGPERKEYDDYVDNLGLNLKHKHSLPIIHLRPKTELPGDSFSFTQPTMSDLIDQGFRESAQEYD